MTTVSLKIRLNYNQILELTQQLSDDDKLELSRALAVETVSYTHLTLPTILRV